MIRVSEGKYRIGDTKVLIFVRVIILFGTKSIISFVRGSLFFEENSLPIRISKA
jgi:hypothetical protein